MDWTHGNREKRKARYERKGAECFLISVAKKRLFFPVVENKVDAITSFIKKNHKAIQIIRRANFFK